MKKRKKSVKKETPLELEEGAEEDESIKKRKERALDISLKEGATTAASGGLAGNYITPFALVLGAQPIHIGFLSSLSGLGYHLSQLFSIKAMERYSRKSIVLHFLLAEMLLLLVIGSLSFFLLTEYEGSLVYILIILYTGYLMLAGIRYPAWFSWMGDIVPAEHRGEYFSKRSKLIYRTNIVIVLLAAFLLDMFKTKGYILLGFSVLFAIAFFFRFVSYLYLRKQYSPRFRQKKRDYFSFWSFIKRYDNFGKFSVYQGFFNLAHMIATPFFAVYMLTVLGFSYTIFTIVNLSLVLFLVLFLPLTGKISDKYGNKVLLKIGNYAFIVAPLLWIVSQHPVWLILAPQMIAGLGYAAIIISYNNFTYDAVSQKHRAICMSYTNILVGFGIFFGSLAGGLIINYFHPANLNPYIFLFIISASLMFLVAAFFLPVIKEVRKVKRFPSTHAMMHYPMHAIHLEMMRFSKLFGKFKSPRLFKI